MSTLVQTPTATPSVPRWKLWTGLGLSALPVLAMILSASMKLSHAPKIVDMFVGKFGYQEGALTGIGILELVCVALYVVPRTAVLGAILLCTYLGGAVATHVRVADNFLPPVVLGVIAWLGIYLREPRLQALVPLRKPDGG